MEEYQYQMPEDKTDKKEVLKTVGVIFAIGLLLMIYTFFPKNMNKAEKEYTKIVDKLCGSAVTYSELSGIEKNIPGETIYVRVGELQASFLVSNNDLIDPRYDGEDAKISERAYVRLSLNQDGELYCEGLINNSNDANPPIVNLKGSETITVAKGTNFLDPGAKAVDDVDGDVSSNVQRSGNVDTNHEGEYKIKYISSDMAGNTTVLTRTIKVQSYSKLQETKPKLIDRISPRIDIKGNNPYCVKLGTKYIEPGVEARDNIDGNISNKIVVNAKINKDISNNYRVTYKVSDMAGNKATAYRSIIVKEDCTPKKVEKLVDKIKLETSIEKQEETTKINTRPQISLLGDTVINININENYSDLGANAYDLEDGDITHKIKVDSSKVNINKGGIYTVYFEVSDSGGLIGKVERIVNVIDPNTTSNVARFNKTPQDLRIKLGHEDKIEVLTAKDSLNNNLNVEVEIEDSSGNKVNSIDYYKVGNYRIKYTARPIGGVLQMVDRKVEIYDNVIPFLFVPSTITETLKSENCEITEEYLFSKGLTTYDSNNKIMPKLVVSNTKKNLCTLNEEGFNISVYSMDFSGNKSVPKNIKIKVIPSELATPEVNVTNVEIKNCSTGKLKLKTESVVQLDALVYPLDATNKKVTWSSTDSDIVSVKDGNLKTTTVDGTITISVNSIDGDKSDTCEILVEKKDNNTEIISAQSVEIGGCESGSIIIQKGTSKLLNGKIKPENSTNNMFDWSSNNLNVSITKNGEIKGINIGESTIELKSKDGNKTAICKIQVVEEPLLIDTTAPLKVIVLSNNANESDPYNKMGLWYGGIGRKEIKLAIESIEKESIISKYVFLDKYDQVIEEYYPLVSNNNKAEVYWTNDINEEVTIIAINSQGLKSERSDSILLKLDNTGPTTTFTSWIENPDTWTNETNVKVKYTSVDNFSGIQKYEYTHDDVKAKKLSEVIIAGTTNQIEITFQESNLNKYVYVRAVDNLGNAGPWTQKPSYLNMDSRPPKAPVISLLNNNTSKVTVGFIFEDSISPKISGFGKFEYKINNGLINEILKEKETFDLTTEGTYRIDAWSYDKAGNKSLPTHKDNIKVIY